MHIDVNNAYLSWTAVDLLKKGHKVDIRDIEAIIGGDESKRTGIVLAKSPIAKKKGVKTTETLFAAKKKCNDLKIYPPNFNVYNEMSNATFDIISSYTPDIEIVSVDECYIDYTNVKNLYGDPVEFAYKLKDEIYEKLGFTVNIGVANNKLCAKMASDLEKPNKVHTLFENEVEEKMYILPVRDLYGVGKKTSEKLNNLNIMTIGDLANSTKEYLVKHFKNQTEGMINSAKGICNSKVVTESEERKGISISTTYEYNLLKTDDVIKKLQILCEKVCLRLRREEKYAKVIGVKIKDKYFVNYSHQRKLLNATNNTDIVFKTTKELILELWNEEPIRLMGVSLTNLTSVNNRQISLFEKEEEIEKNDDLEKILDKLKKQYGSSIVKKASLVDKNP